MNQVLKIVFVLQNKCSNINNSNNKKVVGKILHVKTWHFVEQICATCSGLRYILCAWSAVC